MDIHILGAHNLESASTRLPGILVDDLLALDAGSLTSSLSQPEQGRVLAVLLTHRHFDHIRDVATLGLYRHSYRLEPLRVFGLPDTLEAVQQHLINGVLYPAMTKRPSAEAPSVRLCPVEAGVAFSIEQYQVLPLPVQHGVPSVGYYVRGPKGGTLFYTGDTTAGLAESWKALPESLDVLIIEGTFPNRMEAVAVETNHMTPRLLRSELVEVRRLWGRLPKVIAVHMSPAEEPETRAELQQVARELGADIAPAYKGMRVRV